MSELALCNGTITAVGGPAAPFQCSGSWSFIEYVPPADSTAIYSQLVALNDFDTVQIASFITFSLLMLLAGFITGIVIRNMRRV